MGEKAGFTLIPTSLKIHPISVTNPFSHMKYTDIFSIVSYVWPSLEIVFSIDYVGQLFYW